MLIFQFLSKGLAQFLTFLSFSGLSWVVAKRGQKTLVAGEPEGPKLVTAIPGPVSKQRMAELNEIQSMASVQFFVDYDK